MKVQLLLALAALAPCLCDTPPPSNPFPKPLILDIYQKDYGKTACTENPVSTIDDGDSPNKDNPSYLKHMKWTSASDPERQFTLVSGMGIDVQCSVIVSGDPKTENLIYHVDSRTFESKGEPDLSTVHIRCDTVSGGIHHPYTYAKSDDWIEGYNNHTSDPATDDAKDAFAAGLADKQFEDKNNNIVASPQLSNIDFEQELHIIFQMSEQPSRFNSSSFDNIVGRFKSDLLWVALRGSMSEDEGNYQYYAGSSAQRAYKKMQTQAKYPQILYKEQTEEEERSGSYKGDLSPEEDKIITSDDYKTPTGPWFGEVGRMVFGRSQIAAREFTWKLNSTDVYNEGVKNTIDTTSKKCRVNVNYDPHVSVAYVIMDNDEPEVKLDYNNPGEKEWNKMGDARAITVTCDKLLTDKGPEPDVAPTRITPAALSSAQSSETEATGDGKGGESDAAAKDLEPTPVAAA